MSIIDAINTLIDTKSRQVVDDMYNLYASQTQQNESSLGQVYAVSSSPFTLQQTNAGLNSGTGPGSTTGSGNNSPNSNGSTDFSKSSNALLNTSGVYLLVQLPNGQLKAVSMVNGNYVGIGSYVAVSGDLAFATDG